MTDNINEKVLKLTGILMPYAADQREMLRADPRLAYYTTCETANLLIRNQELWLRDCSLMNDVSEVRHGIALIDKFFSDAGRKAGFVAALDACHLGAATQALEMFEEWKTNRSARTYLMSFSRHATRDTPDGIKEDQYGRLSMWRGYGGPQGVALIFNIPIGVAAERLKLFFSPVGYLDTIDLHLGRIIERITVEKDFLASLLREWLVNGLYIMLVMAATSLKHPGFYEEEEWRLLYLPTTYASPFVSECKVNLNGKEETICKTTFEALTKGGMPGLDLHTLVDRIIVGPTEFPGEIERFMIDALRDKGVPDAASRVHVSHTPFRFNK